MQRLDFDLTNNLSLAGRVGERLNWLHQCYGLGDDWGVRTFLRRPKKLTKRWAFGTYQPTPVSTSYFSIWLPDDIKLLYDITWPENL
jgi:hypothetical protein